MLRRNHVLIAVAALGLAACDAFPNLGTNLALNQAFQTVPLGFSANTNSFSASGDLGTAFFPGAFDQVGGPGMGGMGGPGGMMGGGRGGHHGGDHDGDHHDGFGPGMGPGLMGGGLGPEFAGLLGFGHGRHGGPFGIFQLSPSCTFAAGTGRVSCPDTTERGLTVSASYAFKDAAGAAQQAFDSASTDYVNVQIKVAGTRTRRDSSTSTVLNTSERSVKGLTTTTRTVNGTASAEETTTGTRDGVAFTAKRLAGDTTTNLVIPVDTTRPPLPTSGTVVRSMSITITPAGSDPTTHTRREVITYNGTSTISLQITQDGVTKNCTITLPDRHPSCE